MGMRVGVCVSLKKRSTTHTVRGPLRDLTHTCMHSHIIMRMAWLMCTPLLVTGLNVQLFQILFVSILCRSFCHLPSSHLSAQPSVQFLYSLRQNHKPFSMRGRKCHQLESEKCDKPRDTRFILDMMIDQVDL